VKGLLLKDWYILKNKGKMYLIIVPIYLAIAFRSQNLLFVFFSIVFAAMIPRTLAAYDDHAHWNCYTAALPVSKKQIVQSRYLLSLMFILLFTLCAVILNFIIPFSALTSPLILAGIASTGIGYIAISFPLLYRFGTEKGRMIQTLLMMFFMIWGGIFSALLAAVSANANALLLLERIPPLAGILSVILLLFSALLLFLSYLLSVKWYRYIPVV